MDAINKLLEEAKDKAGLTSDYALANAMGIKKQTVSRYKLGLSTPDIYSMRRLADLTGKTLDEIAASIEIEKETDETKKEYWRNFYKRLGGVAASLLVTMIVTSTYSEPTPLLNIDTNTLYIMLNLTIIFVIRKAALAWYKNGNAVRQIHFSG